jgi:hypothetical protein
MAVKRTALLISLSFAGSLIACSTSPKNQRTVQTVTQKSDLSKFDQVQLGLPAAEVVKLLGEPSRRYTKGNDKKANYWIYTRASELGPLPFITVKLDQNSTVTAKGLEVADQNLTLAKLENHYRVKDLELVKTVVGCNGSDEKLGADVYRSKELGAEISVSFKGDIQRFVQNDQIKLSTASANSRPVCRAKR